MDTFVIMNNLENKKIAASELLLRFLEGHDVVISMPLLLLSG